MTELGWVVGERARAVIGMKKENGVKRERNWTKVKKNIRKITVRRDQFTDSSLGLFGVSHRGGDVTVLTVRTFPPTGHSSLGN